MSLGKSRFEAQLVLINKLLVQSKNQENSVYWLYENNIRTSFFMLEGLARLYAQAHNKKQFTKIKEKAKEVEDAFGALDYYLHYIQLFAKSRKVSREIKSYLESQYEKSYHHCHTVLKKQGWYSGKRFEKIEKQLRKVDWKDEEVEIALFSQIYKEESNQILQFLRDHEFVFCDMEHDVHELRRKIRWLSIYPQALLGAVKLVPNSTERIKLESYHTDEIENSPYNQFKAARKLKSHLKLSKPNFIALSWFIDQLGSLKDKGQAIEILTYSTMKVEGIDKEQAENRAYQMLSKSYPKEEVLLEKATKLSQKFVSDGILDQLVLK